MALPVKLGIAGSIISVLGIAFGWVLFPSFLNSQINANVALVPGNEMRRMWEKVPFPIDFKIYIFNITNSMEVQLGDVPVLDEIGPFFYDEWKEKANVVDHPEDDTVSFNMLNTWVFNKKKSAPLTGEEVVVVPHLPIMGMIMAVERQRPAVLGLVNKAIPFIYDNPTSVFLKTKVNDLLFNGNIINCTVKDFSATAICTAMKKEGKDLVQVEPNVYKFSMFGHRNGTPDSGLFRVRRGSTNAKLVGEVVTYNNQSRMKVWGGQPCDDIVGTDSTIFPPLMTQKDNMTSFAPDLCLSLGAYFVEKHPYKGFNTWKYTAQYTDQSYYPHHKCYCPTPTTCMKKGVVDLAKCLGPPVLASKPHFYDAHEDYLKGVRGLHPDPEKHDVILYVEPITASPLYGKKRLQFSMPFHKVDKISLTENLTSTYVPFVWVEEGIELEDDVLAKLDGQLFRVLRIVDVIKWLMTIGGGVLIGGAFGLNYKRKLNAFTVTPTDTRSNTAPNADVKNGFENTEHNGGHNNLGYIM